MQAILVGVLDFLYHTFKSYRCKGAL